LTKSLLANIERRILMSIETIGVLGAGIMGSGVAQVAAQAGFRVVMRDIEDRFVEHGLKTIDKFLSKSVEKGKMTLDEKKAVMERINGTTRMEDLKNVDFVVEVATESMDVKRKVFMELEELTRKDVILSTNTSSMSITKIGTATQRPDKVVGMHFFNPVPLMKLVEIVRGMKTSDETVAIAKDLSGRLGKEYVEVKIDTPGFLSTRLVHAHFMEAISLYERGIASKEDIDKTARLALNYPMGPFELMDFGGLDLALHVQKYLSEELPKEQRWDVPNVLKNMVTAELLGRKTGQGWYDYSK
jgi:3-hydroxybutyryl-CoA dehydrogenase